METLIDIKNYFLVIIAAGGLARIMYCFVKISWNEDEKSSLMKKGKNTFAFMIIAPLVTELIELFVTYFGEGGKF